ncbi:SusC/RagA family TonB-linked outer membrane protein [Mucilaginibacter conchicola]|uniref:SusC/RagA family TonB-linked outer membrane protein n=1 Tax=Mucilaginibacter conchicola TaxID=2303333 RepID=A0A372NTR3_9SPHI|nr:SusC/RagA family TonB-linked outer membrane protein [Mucilaginibacter conchicola]RFZ92625.1 SusC/RagA family TonB-linked outer membrane protein [Mucilaginibacter conchicola]
MKKLLLVSLCFLSLFVTQVYAQNRTITGTVTSKDDGLPLPGVSVTVTGTSIGTQTSATGKFSLQVPASAKALRFTFVGFQPAESPIGANGTVNLAMTSSAAQLTEVVITGAFGVKQNSRTSSGSAQQVGGAQLNVVRQTNVNNALAGKVAGLQVRSQSAGALGRQTEVRLRGASGFGTGNGAIYIVDGTIVTNIDDINNDDIESVTVLQGPASSAQFGPQAANGAILITLAKARKTDGLGIDLNLGTQFDVPYILPNYQNVYGGGAAADFMQYTWKAGDPEEWKPLSGKYYPDYSDDASWGPKMVGQEYIPWYSWYPGTKYTGTTAKWTPQPDNARDFYQTGITLNNSVSFNKAADNYNVKVSYGNQYTRGLIPTTYLLKNTFMLNTSVDLSKKLTLSANINYTNSKLNGEINDAYSNNSSGSFNQWFHRDLDMGILQELRYLKSPDGAYATWNHLNPTAYNPSDPRQFYAANYWYNPYTAQDLHANFFNRDRLFGNIGLAYKITDDLTLRGTYRKAYVGSWEEQKYSSQLNYSGTQTQGNEARNKGYYYTSTTYSNRENWEFVLNYNKTIKDFSIKANAGTDVFNWTYKDNSANTNNGLSIDDLFTIGNSVDPATVNNSRIREQYRALYGNANIGYKGLVFLEGTLRNDWISVLPSSKPSILSKSFGGSFVFSDLLKSQSSWLSYGKVRATWGQSPKAFGNGTTFGAYTYPGALYGVSAFKFGNNLVQGINDQYIDPALKGSVVTMKEFGLDMRFFNDRFGFTATYWDGTEVDFPQSIAINGASGYTSIYTNVGKVARKGLDITLSGQPFRSENFTWTISGTYGRLLDNKVIEISNKYDITRIPAGQYVWGTDMPYLVHEKGKQWGQIYGNGILRNSAGVPILSATGFYQNDPNVYFGSAVPRHTGGLQNSFTVFKDFTINANFDYQFGGKFVSLSNSFGSFSGLTARTAVLNDKGNPIRDAVADGGGVHTTGVDKDGKPVSFYVEAQDYFHNLNNVKTYDPYIYDLTFIKLRELGVSYRIPVQKLGISKYIKNASFQVVGRDLFLLYAKTKDFDPSQVIAVTGETGQLPGTRAIGFNLRVGF